MKKLISIGFITFATFFMAGCDLLDSEDLVDLPGIELVGETYAEVNSSFAIGIVNGTNGTVSRLFGIGNEYALVNIYAYDNQIVTKDSIGLDGGSDIFYIYIRIATSEQFNDANYYIDHLGWSSHFFDFSNLDIENGDMPTLK